MGGQQKTLFFYRLETSGIGPGQFGKTSHKTSDTVPLIGMTPWASQGKFMPNSQVLRTKAQ